MLNTAYLSALRGALLAALGLTACSSRPIEDLGTEEGDASSAGGTAGGSTAVTTTAPSGETGASTSGTGVTTGATTTQGAATTGVHSTGVATTTAADSSGGVIEGSTSGSTSGEASTSGTTVDSTGTTGDCVLIGTLGQDLMAADVAELPGCVETMPHDCNDFVKICQPRPADAETCEACGDSCLVLPELCDAFIRGPAFCGPWAEGEQCCSVFEYGWNCTDGRPFVVDGKTRTATVVAGDAWSGEVTPGLLAELDAASRAELAALWTADGLAEHASVASFARFTLQLLGLGAPPELVAAACQAQLDEVAHARVTLGLAAAYGGQSEPGALAITGALTGSVGREEVLVATLIEGCVGETIAAAELELAAQGCADAVVAAALRGLAADEQRHATLAWRTVQWLLGSGGAALRGALRTALASVHVELPAADRLPAGLLLRHGRLPASERVALAEQCLGAVIRPCAAALLGEVREPPRATA